MKLLLFLLLMLAHLRNYGQKPYYNQRSEFLKGNCHWVMPGDSAGLDFSSGSAVTTRTSMRGWEGGAAVSDPITGKLLFYSNGEQCWDANDAVMPNGDSLLGNSRYSLPNLSLLPTTWITTEQGVCIVPVLAEEGKYYLFSLSGRNITEMAQGSSPGSLFYSVIDMNLNNGLGDLEPNRKNIPLYREKLSEMMIAIPGDCGDIWLLVHSSPEEDFYAYHITKAGIDTIPVVSNVATSLPTTYGPLFHLLGYYQAYAAKSPNRKKVAISATALFFICEFDPKTGKVAHPVEVPALMANGNEPCFSPDNSKLYISTADSVFQLNVSVYDSLSINSSIKGIVTNTSFDSTNFRFEGSNANMRLYNDSVYVWFYGGYSANNRHISRINQPNLDGINCGFEQKAVSILEGTTIVFGLGNEVVFPLPPDTFYNPTIDTGICDREMLLAPQSLYEDALWNDGSTEKNKLVATGGVYWVVQNDGCNVYVDTFVVEHWKADPIINVREKRLGTTQKYLTYQWMLNGVIIPSAKDSIYTVPNGGNGDYQVIVSNEHCVDTSEVYVVNNAGTGIGLVSHLADQIQIYPNPATDKVFISSPVKVNILVTSIDGKIVKKEDSVTEFSVANLAEGIYILHVFDLKHRVKVIKFTKAK